MTDFERGIQRALAIYQAGVRGEICPTFRGIDKDDAQALYTQGVLDAATELDSIDLLPGIKRFLTRYTLTEH
jgi:hypothetical protein